MSDERLGTNPLDWVIPDAAPAAVPPMTENRPVDQTTQPAPPACATKDAEPAAPRTALFQPAGSNEEMTMGKGKIKIEQTMDTSHVVAYLKDLADSLESGVIRAENENETLVLGVPDSMQVELKLARKKDKAKCEIELQWYDDGSRADALKISGE
ncbi:amphi-Trp domain-containing protein [uncultured Pseudodesulfovibrio sp.]|uniref:amphi-Trp domain-containing protein n=1 Tax=uncultured Pseudodesulfovibrio sp. TaxID=2035858 RepID=UPI0029C77217|nr:amphi-Trp domain-containing protein [uncultured Pseudodesulfovibrio sp.]